MPKEISQSKWWIPDGLHCVGQDGRPCMFLRFAPPDQPGRAGCMAEGDVELKWPGGEDPYRTAYCRARP